MSGNVVLGPVSVENGASRQHVTPVELGVVPASVDNSLSIDSSQTVIGNFFPGPPESQLIYIDLLVGATLLWDLVVGRCSLLIPQVC